MYDDNDRRADEIPGIVGRMTDAELADLLESDVLDETATTTQYYAVKQAIERLRRT